MIRWFDRTPGYEAATFAEAQALVDDGLDVDLVLDLFGDDAAWLEPLLRTAADVCAASAAEEPSFYFEASLKAKFLAAGAAAARGERTAPAAAVPLEPVPHPAGISGMVRTAVAGLTVMTTAAALGVLTLGFVTAGDAVPGDWNYSVKMAQERLQYTLSSGDQRVDIQLKQTERRVYELQKQAVKGEVSTADISRLQREASELAAIARTKELDDVQKARLKTIAETSTVILNEVSERQVALAPQVETTKETVSEAMAAAGIGGPIQAVTTPTASATPTSTETATPTPTESATPEPTTTPTATPTETVTPVPTASATPTGSATPEPTESTTPTPTPTPTETPSPSVTGTVAPLESATPSTTPTP